MVNNIRLCIVPILYLAYTHAVVTRLSSPPKREPKDEATTSFLASLPDSLFIFHFGGGGIHVLKTGETRLKLIKKRTVG